MRPQNVLVVVLAGWLAWAGWSLLTRPRHDDPAKGRVGASRVQPAAGPTTTHPSIAVAEPRAADLVSAARIPSSPATQIVLPPAAPGSPTAPEPPSAGGPPQPPQEAPPSLPDDLPGAVESGPSRSGDGTVAVAGPAPADMHEPLVPGGAIDGGVRSASRIVRPTDGPATTPSRGVVILRRQGDRLVLRDADGVLQVVPVRQVTSGRAGAGASRDPAVREVLAGVARMDADADAGRARSAWRTWSDLARGSARSSEGLLPARVRSADPADHDELVRMLHARLAEGLSSGRPAGLELPFLQRLTAGFEADPVADAGWAARLRRDAVVLFVIEEGTAADGLRRRVLMRRLAGWLAEVLRHGRTVVVRLADEGAVGPDGSEAATEGGRQRTPAVGRWSEQDLAARLQPVPAGEPPGDPAELARRARVRAAAALVAGLGSVATDMHRRDDHARGPGVGADAGPVWHRLLATAEQESADIVVWVSDTADTATTDATVESWNARRAAVGESVPRRWMVLNPLMPTPVTGK